jgi:hypothetical protein
MKSLMVSSLGRLKRTLLASAIVGAGAMSAPAFADPAYALITVPADKTVPADLSDTLSDWQDSGLVSDVTRLDYSEATGEELSSLVILDFDDEDAYNDWSAQVNGKLPAGVTVRQADLSESGGDHTKDRSDSYYKVHILGIPDTPLGLSKFEGFLDGYMKPLMDGQHEAGILVSYRIFIEREPNGEPGRSIWAAQYRSADAYGQTETIKPKIRAHLIETDPTFANYRQIYKGLRVALAFYSADYVSSEAATAHDSH